MNTSNNCKIAFVIPAYNESKSIKKVIASLHKEIAEKYLYDIIVIDDGSTDNTATLAAPAGAIVIEHIINCGAGRATATGLSYAQQNGYSLAVTLDADGQHCPKDVLNGVKYMQKGGTDLLIGSRLLDATAMPRLKVIGNRGLTYITKLLFNVHITDSQSGLRIYSKKALDVLRWRTSGYEFCSEMLWRAKEHNLVIKEYQIKAIYSEYSRAKGQSNWNAIIIVKLLIHRRIVEMFE